MLRVDHLDIDRPVLGHIAQVVQGCNRSRGETPDKLEAEPNRDRKGAIQTNASYRFVRSLTVAVRIKTLHSHRQVLDTVNGYARFA